MTPSKLKVEDEMFTRTVWLLVLVRWLRQGPTYEGNTSGNDHAHGRDSVKRSCASGVGDGAAGSSWGSDLSSPSV